MKIVVIIPTYNEKDNIENLINILEEEIFPQIKKDEMWLLVADDKSPDGTGKIVEEFQSKYKNIYLLEGDKQGLGAAYVRAMEYAMDKMQADAVVEFDADLQHDPNDIPRLVEAFDQGADYVIGSRYVKGGAIPKEWGLDRKIKSVFGSLFARILLFTFDVHDMTSGLKLTRTSYLRKVDLDHLLSKNYAYKIQILYEIHRMGAKFKEIPIVFREREKGKSKMDPNDLIESFLVVIRLRIRDSKSFLKFLVVGGTGFLLNAIGLRLFVEIGHLNPSIANLVANVFVIFVNYNLNNLWTFSHNRATSFGAYFSKMVQFYLTSSIGVIFIQTGTIFLGDTFIGRQFYFLYFILGTGLLLIWNFTIYSRFIWKNK